MNKKIFLLVLAVAVAVGLTLNATRGKSSAAKMQETHPFTGDIRVTVSTTGTVEPQNRLEIKPPIAGRVEEIRVQEGQEVQSGDVLALMSSTDRAALLDMAMIKGAEELKYWQEVYKATSLIAPINGDVIVRAVEPGQTVTTSDAILVLSDRLIVSADVDETDIGRVHVGQKAVVGLDAYPDIKVNAQVNHISYESTLVNNVTIYAVDIVPESVPEVFRSGMSANVEIIVQEKTGVFLLPLEALSDQEGHTVVLVKDQASGSPVPVFVQTGIRDDNYVEIVSGLSPQDTVVLPEQTVSLPAARTSGKNPFMPSRPGRGK
ncbi:MAG TPA: efflux RND transporter periplasmic adaptor subunit [Candidatus Omnitrophota bacterium]|nr:efflux RND transporter periplasmic adaptor subunit [Candidatus Omnitrophota bacterium]HQO58203.1 efflux RND transporter periplasmic adaptor subunit [Candidatus Omnitrophota bacterium]HQP12909.1 efflux RND transporter periplasmic adaptor subunit [Candidatus Omnitrophota bacterium]